MKKIKIAFFPYTYENNTYISMIKHILQRHCEVFDYSEINTTADVACIDVFYFNWIEDSLSERDKKLIEWSFYHGKRIIWVFHNRISHDCHLQKIARDNIAFMISNATDIIVLTLDSIKYLYEYNYNYSLSEKKIHHLQHPHYIDNYGKLQCKPILDKDDSCDLVLGFFGTIREDKNIDVLIKAYKRFENKNRCKLVIVGKVGSLAYLNYISELLEGENSIIFIPEEVKDYSMAYLFGFADIIVMPYSTKSCMNSGIMLLAFSNKKTVITSDISMAEEYDNELIYKFEYCDNTCEDALLTEIRKAYCDGKSIVKKKGKELYKQIYKYNSIEEIEKKLSKIIGFSNQYTYNKDKKYMLKEKNAWLEKWICDVIQGTLINTLRNNPDIKLAIYGFGKYGRLLYKELIKENISVFCIIDQDTSHNDEGIKVCSLENISRDIDYIIVSTPQIDVWDLRQSIRSYEMHCYVFGLIDI